MHLWSWGILMLKRFWVDMWLGNKPLKDRFSVLFNIVRRKQDTVAKVMSFLY
jgi:hypothetical protein